ncbi:PTS sugar transporter subunit IIA [Lentibacillus sp. CBA3610]|uniref:PTS sugar transporter subunit IIA n=1 Tax=Lentibacillus sp. CBA3610 TaxID=2518176 RepID=UPI001595EF20|nr:PTS sugar transporter subunit IIA [Lentibacillus sp. CBA3610]QKY68736.1 PTS sugar transporter subunit IIA [Lentibacillus sp. CBA3610]
MDKSEIEVMKLDISTDKEALKYMGDFLVFQGIAKKNFPEKVMEREMALPTGLPVHPYGVAVPHTDSEYAIKRQLLVAPLKNPVVFAQMGDPDQHVKVSFVFMLAAPESSEHLTLIQNLFTCFEDDRFNQGLASWDGKKSSLKQLIQRHG